MPYQQVIQAGQLGSQFAAHARQHARRVATSATEPYAHWLNPGQEFLDLYQHQMALGEKLEQLEAELFAIDHAHVDELERDRQVRLQREQWVSEVRESLLKLKSILDSSVGERTSWEIFKEDPRLPRGAKSLRHIGQRVFDTLSDPGFTLVSSQPGVLVNAKLVAESLGGPLGELGSTLKRLAESESETKHTQSEKDVALNKLLEFDGQVARYFEALYDLAGHKLLASRLRRSSHVRRLADGGTAIGEGPGIPGDPAPDAAPEPAATAAADEVGDGDEETAS